MTVNVPTVKPTEGILTLHGRKKPISIRRIALCYFVLFFILTICAYVIIA